MDGKQLLSEEEPVLFSDSWSAKEPEVQAQSLTHSQLLPSKFIFKAKVNYQMVRLAGQTTVLGRGIARG